MIQLSEQEIKDIAEEIDMGLLCYYHVEKKEYRALPDFETEYDADPEPWEDYIQEIEADEEAFVVFRQMSSRDAFQVMVDFLDEVDDEKIQDLLYQALQKKRPFSRFKQVIDETWDYRENCFAYKEKRNREWVQKQLDIINLNREG